MKANQRRCKAQERDLLCCLLTAAAALGEMDAVWRSCEAGRAEVPAPVDNHSRSSTG
jgi:hypothetical protein